MTSDYQPVRKLHPDGTISVRLLDADGSEPPAGTPELPTDEYPATRLTDKRYKLDQMTSGKKLHENLQWLSDNHPMLFEEVLCFLEGINEDQSKPVTKTLNHHLVPSRDSTESYILAYYRQAIDTSALSFALAADGWYGSDDIRAWSLFVGARTACGFTVEHPRFKAVMLAIWIMQESHHPVRNPLWTRDNDESIAFIDRRFDEVYDARHELRSVASIDSSYLEEFLRQPKALRIGVL